MRGQPLAPKQCYGAIQGNQMVEGESQTCSEPPQGMQAWTSVPPPYSYLGFRLERETFGVQPIALRRDNLKILNDFQKLLGDINWIRPYLHLATYELKPLFDILKGDKNPTSQRSLTEVESELFRKWKLPYHSTTPVTVTMKGLGDFISLPQNIHLPVCCFKIIL